MHKPIVYPSADKKHIAVLSIIDEIQPGLGYYSLSIDNYPLSSAIRIFGKVCMWSPDSRFLAVQEWKDINSLKVPKFYLLLLIDVLTRRECVIASIESVQGNILPQGFIGDSLMYTVIYFGQFGMTKNYESNFQYLDGWQPLK